MKTKDRDILNRLMREHEGIFGASRVTMVALQAFMTSIEQLDCPPEQLRDQYVGLVNTIKKTQPKVIPLIHLLEEFESEMAPHFGGEPEAVKEKALEILQAKHDKLHAKSGKIVQLGLDCVNDGETIVVHTVNVNVINIITLAHQVMDRKINVIVLQQDLAKTRRMINQLKIAEVKLKTVPEYSLSHHIEQADKMFCAALSITADGQVVAPVGTANIASLCHFHQIPVYLFANTLKFAHGRAQDQLIHTETITQSKDAGAYELTTYSHDMMDLNMVDYLVTEDGVYPKEEIGAYVKTLQ